MRFLHYIIHYITEPLSITNLLYYILHYITTGRYSIYYKSVQLLCRASIYYQSISTSSYFFLQGVTPFIMFQKSLQFMLGALDKQMVYKTFPELSLEDETRFHNKLAEFPTLSRLPSSHAYLKTYLILNKTFLPLYKQLSPA